MKKFERYSLFALNAYSFMISGLIMNTGSSLSEFGKIFDVSLVELSHGMTIKAIISCLGSLSATYTLDKWNRQLQFAIASMLAAIVVALLPLCISINNYFILIAFMSFFAPITSSVPMVWTAELFSKKSAFYIQMLNFFFSFGGIITPLLLAPFLSEDVKDTTEESRLWIPYLVLGTLQLLSSIFIFTSYVIKPYQAPSKNDLKPKNDINEKENQIELDEIKQKNEKNLELNEKFEHNLETEKQIDINLEKNNNNCSQRYIVLFVTLTSILISLQIATEVNSLTFLPTYLEKSSLGLDPKKAAYITTTLPVFITTTRFFISFLTFKIPVEYMLFFNFTFMFLGYISLVLFGLKEIIMVWVSLAILGVGFSSTVPLIYCYVQKNISLTNKYTSIFGFARSLCQCFMPFIISHFLVTEPNNFVILNLISIVLMLIVFTLLRISERFKNSIKS